MSYQVPLDTQGLFLLGETTAPMYRVKPTKVLKLQNGVVTMFIKGHIGADFKMRLNVYKDGNGNNLMLSSTPVNNQDITRIGDYYCEIRFDFPTLNNRLAVGVQHLVEFEIYDGYTYDANNYVTLIEDYMGAMAYCGSDTLALDSATDLGIKFALFLGELETQTDEKFYMVRIAGSKLMNGIAEATIPTAGKYLYTATIQTNLFIDVVNPDGFVICEAGGTEANLTRVYSPIVVNPLDYSEGLETYYYDPSTGVVQFYSIVLLDNPGAYGIINYFLFFTNFRGRYADPYMSELSLVTYWEPRLLEGLSFDFSQENNFNGILSISASSIELKNQDKYMNAFFSPNDCFNNREIVCWRCEGDTGVIATANREFIGTIRAASVNDEQCSFEVQDLLATLDKSYEDSDPLHYDELGYTTTSIREQDRSKIVPRMFGKCGPYELEKFDTGQAYTTGYNYFIRVLNTEKMTQMTCVSYLATPKTTANNRTWSIGFGPSVATTKTFDVTLHSNFLEGAFSASVLTIDTAGGDANEFFAPGDTIKNGTQYGRIWQVFPSQLFIWPYNASFSAANDVIRAKVGAVVINQAGVLYYPVHTRDYTCQIGAGGDLQIVFTNNFEANLAGMTFLDPDIDTVYGRAWNDESDGTASAIVSELITNSGLIASGSFAPAQIPLAPGAYDGKHYPDPILSLTVPFAGSSEMPTFREVIELCLKTAMAFIYIDSSGYFRYKSFLDSIYEDITGEPTSDYINNQSGKNPLTDGVNTTKSNDYSVQFDLYDLFSGVSFSFTHNPTLDDANETSFGTYSTELKAVSKFYKTNRKYQVECVADRNAPAFDNYIEKYVKLVIGRRASFNLRAFTTNGIFLGDDLLISRNKIVGSDNEAYMKVVSISKGINEQKLTLLDLKRFPGL